MNTLTYKFEIPLREDIVAYSKVANNLYNQALYLFKQRLEQDGVWTWYKDMEALMRTQTNLEGTINYKLLPAKTSQQTLRKLDQDMRSYCKAIKDWSKNKDKYKGKPQMPRYKKRGALSTLYFSNQQATIRNGTLKLTWGIQIKIPQYDKYADRLQDIRTVRIVPLFKSFRVEIVYQTETPNCDVDKSKYAAIDLGLDNLATLVCKEKTAIYSGKYLLSYNRHFNKRLAKLKSIKDKQGIKGTTRQIQSLYDKRKKYIDDSMHKVSRMIVDFLIEHKIGNLVVGYNKDWKQSVNLGRTNNQKFVELPLARLSDYLKYKCEMAGIVFTLHEESYTSKCDALALEPIGKHEEYLGKRIRRGLFQSSTRTLINADVNGAINILRKVVGDSPIIQEIVNSGRLSRPSRYSNPFQKVV